MSLSGLYWCLGQAEGDAVLASVQSKAVESNRSVSAMPEHDSCNFRRLPI